MGLLSPSEQTILVTGISGFVASFIAQSFLEAGYKVRGTVRSTGGLDDIKKAHIKYVDRLSFAIVPDIAAPNALHNAAEGVTGIIHTANPFILQPKDNENDLLKPSIQGVLNALEAAATQGSKVHRVVLTASFACIVDLSQGARPGYTYTTADWNPATYVEAKTSPNGAFVYCAAKALAEKSAWNWIESHKPNFTFTAIHPPWVFGPSLNGIKSLAHLNESSETIWKLVNGSTKTVPPVDFAGFADVRDVAAAHLRVYEREEAGNQRFIVGSHFDYQTAVDHLREDLPAMADRIPKGTPGSGLKEATYQLDGSKAQQVLGIEYTPLNITLRDTVTDLLEAEKRLNA
jgi:NADPH-dependent methylglyoxal reductase